MNDLVAGFRKFRESGYPKRAELFHQLACSQSPAMKTILSAVTALTILAGSTVAFADSGDAPAPQWPLTPPAQIETMTAAPIAGDVGSETPPVFAGQPAVISQGTASLLPFNGNEAPSQTANSAPPGFGTDTAALAAHATASLALTQR